jgi:phospholipid/cholesterol/gamma-HCH transport system substrate-binding protein
MMRPARLAAIGLFVLTGLFLFALGLFLIGDRRMLFRDQFEVNADFEDIAALQTGAKVRVSGMDAGEVTALIVPTRASGKFRVRMRVREDLHPLIRVDSVASIQTDGLVGNKYLEIGAGTDEAARVAAGGTIASREPFDIAHLLERSSDTVESINLTVTQLRGQMQHVLATVGAVATNANEVVEKVGADAAAIAAAGRRISEDTTQIVADIRAGRGTIGKLVKDDELYVRATTIARETEVAVRSAREAAEYARATLANLRGTTKDGDRPVQAMLADLQRTLSSAREATADLEENTEALKRSFFFRGYFADRGYYDLNDLTLAEYRAVGLGQHRGAIRIWLRAEMLFEPAPGAAAGTASAAEMREVLSVEGRRRLDGAMAEVLRYPADTPLVIEGYAHEPRRDAWHLTATGRAEQVRDYLMTRYRLKPNRVGVIAVGPGTKDGVSGDSWNGIALAAWVDERVFSPASRTTSQR